MVFRVNLYASTSDSVDDLAQRLMHRFYPSIHEPGRLRPLGFKGWINDSGFQLTKPGLRKGIPVTATGTFQREGDETVVRASIQPVKPFFVVIAGVIVAWVAVCGWGYFNRSADSLNRSFFSPEIFISTCVCVFVLVWLSVSAWVTLIYLRSELKDTIQCSIDLNRY